VTLAKAALTPSAVKAAVLKIVNDPEIDLPALTEDDVIVTQCHINYGCKASNPLDRVWFYRMLRPSDPLDTSEPTVNVSKLQPSQVGICLPSTFQEHWLRLFSRSSDLATCGRLTAAWSEWCERNKGRVAKSTPAKFSVSVHSGRKKRKTDEV
jgi:hypothetical protein